MSLPDVVSREQWLEARQRLLAQEKELTRRHDELNATRRRLPMVRVDQEYVFEGPDGKVTLGDLFGDKRQLIVQHVMFGPDWDQPCPGCTAAIEELNPGVLDHVASRETAFVLTSRAPYEKIKALADERGWTVPGIPPTTATSITTIKSPWTPNAASATITTAPSLACSAATGPPRCPVTAVSCATATRSSTPTRPSPGAPNTSGTPTPSWI